MRTSSCFILRRSSRAFSTSTPQWPRSRPLAGASRQRLPVASPNTTPQPHDSTSSDQRRDTEQETLTINAEGEQEKKREKGHAHGQHQHPGKTIAASELIRQNPDSSLSLFSSSAPSSSSPDRQRLASAASFFAHPCQFLYSAESLRHHPKGESHVPEVLILGASNVGKSSFLNALVGARDAARVSARPGKTTLMNAFGAGPQSQAMAKGKAAHSLVIVDTPGYGYGSRESWGASVLEYLGGRGRRLRGAVVLVSCDKDRISDRDGWLLRSLADKDVRTIVVLTKADKGGKGWRETCGAMATRLRDELRAIERSLGDGGWGEGKGWDPGVYVTAAGMRDRRGGNGGGIGGVRAAVLEMAGFQLDEGEARLGDDSVAYTGQVVSFDDIKWKT